MLRLTPILALLLFVESLAAAPPEFRGVWIATVNNLDWPSKPGLPAEAQQRELIAMLDRCQQLHLNAVIFQVRPMCDALYESKLEPWSVFLTGVSGRSPGYDPLAFAIVEAHKRKLELHAWLNPYRARMPSARGEPAANHLVLARPDFVKQYGKQTWLNPTHPDVRAHSLAVVRDIVTRYDIDGIHLDDYFYPYPELDANKKELPFPDDDTWTTYSNGGGQLGRDDWRRDTVNQLIRSISMDVHKIKPWVKFGVSPFGIWRPGHPMGIAGFDQYAKLYADAKLWLNEGWVDYLSPQLYWPIAPEKQSYAKLLDWWASENTQQRALWVGNYTGKHSAEEIVSQIQLTRKAKAGGNVHFSMRALMGAKGDAVQKLYAEPAAIPAMPWLASRPMK